MKTRKDQLIDYGCILGAGLTLALRPFFLMFVVNRSVGPEAYGVLSQVFLSASFVVPLVTLRLSSTLTRFSAGSPGAEIARRIGGAIITTAVCTGAAGVGVALAPGIVAKIVFGSAAYVEFVGALVAYFAGKALVDIAGAYFAAMEKQRWTGVLDATGALGEAGLIGFSGASVGLVRAIGFAAAWSAALACLVMAFIFYRYGTLKPSWRDIREHHGFILWLLVSHVVFFGAGMGSRYVLAGVAGIRVVALYSAAWTVAQGVTLVTQANIATLLPGLSARWSARDIEGAAASVRFAYEVMFFVGLPTCVGAAVYGRVLVSVLTSRALVPSSAVIGCLAVTCLVQAVYMMTGYSSWQHGEFLFAVTTQLAGSVVNMGCSYLLIWKLGVWGAVVGGLVASIVMAVPMYRRSIRNYGTGISWPHVARCSVSALACGAILLGLREWSGLSGGWQVILGAIIGGAGYLGVAYRVGCIPWLVR